MKKEMKKFVGIFKVHNGEASYNIIGKIVCQKKREATKFFKGNETPARHGYGAWRLTGVVEVKTFDELWALI